MHITVEAERAWLMVLIQLERDRIALRISKPHFTGGSADAYRCHITYSVTGKSRAAVEYPVALDRICERLVEAEQAHAFLLALGYGKRWDSLPELAQLVPHSTAMLIRQKK
jgi:hypothetical protein